MSWRKIVAILAIPAALSILGSCSKNKKSGNAATNAPVHELSWAVSGSDVLEMGQAPDGIFGIMTVPAATKGTERVELWKWNADTIVKQEAMEVAEPLSLHHASALPGNRYMACVTPRNSRDRWRMVITGIPENKKCDETLLPQGWECEGTGVSRNGKYATIFSPESISFSAADKPKGNPHDVRYRVGITETAAFNMYWIGELIGHPSTSVRTIAVSNDGKYVALGGWENGIAVFSASKKKVLWQGRQPEVVTIGYVDFSSDGLTLYALDSGGGYVFVHDTKDGKVRGRWCASESGNPEYGRRISCMAVSPDDAWVAAGTGPDGLVYLFNAKASGQPVIFPHGLATTRMLSFSPDSKYLASVGGGKIKVWNIGSRTVNPTPSGKPE
jgi:WD40 repeat protein